jgi:hypothetical protein
MKFVRSVLRLCGWLLTPVVAWAASFSGATLAARLTGDLGATAALTLTVAAGGVAALAALLGWLRLLRRSPRLQTALEVSDDGTPLAALGADREGA